MTPAATPSTAQERHIVVAAFPRLPQGLDDSLIEANVTSHAVDGCLMALGEVGQLSRGGATVAALVVPARLLNGQTAAFAQALRQMAPSLRLVATDPQDEPRAAALQQAGVDATIDADAEATAWTQVLGLEPAADASTRNSQFATRNSKLETRNLPPSVLDELIQPGGRPGDAAMAHAKEASAIAGLALASPPGAPPAEDARAEVAFGSHHFGTLHAPPPADAAALEPWAHWLARILTLHRQQQDLWYMAMRDELTGAWNRRYFQRFLRMAIDRAKTDGCAVTLMIFDIDDFKQYNDRHGHGAGDDILRETVKLLKSLVRQDDVVARIGGDEFAVIYWDPHGPRRADSKPPADVVKAAERFRKAVAQHRFPKLAGAPGRLTVSAGLATFPADAATASDLIARADAMAMQSKQQGKNAITFGPGVQ